MRCPHYAHSERTEELLILYYALFERQLWQFWYAVCALLFITISNRTESNRLAFESNLLVHKSNHDDSIAIKSNRDLDLPITGKFAVQYKPTERWTRPLGWSVADPLETRSSPIYYRAEFGRSRSNRTGIGRITKKIRRLWDPPLGWGFLNRPRETRHVLPRQIWSF